MSVEQLKSIEVIAHPLTVVFNTCLKKGYFPTALKLARTEPIFKKGSHTALEEFQTNFYHSSTGQGL